jgi:hypothetical protein
MDSTAENSGENTGSADPATAQEPQKVPMWRLNEVSAQLRAAKEELEAKNQLLNQFRPQQQGPQGPTPEELGLEPAAVKAVERLIAHRVEARLNQEREGFMGAISQIQNGREEDRFLLDHGKENSKYLEKIRGQRAKHFATTKQYQSTEDAFKIVRYDEMIAAQSRKAGTQQAATTQAASAQTEAPETQSLPDAAQTRTQGSTQVAGQKQFHELTPEEQEAYLDRQLGEGNFI